METRWRCQESCPEKSKNHLLRPSSIPSFVMPSLEFLRALGLPSIHNQSSLTDMVGALALLPRSSRRSITSSANCI